MMSFMRQKYGSFKIWQEDYEKEIYTNVYDCFGNGIPVVLDCFLLDCFARR